ncbi:hypothetical protein GCM10010411_18800 [Actinomadura fulvescens]|uniref:Uncharacterized protein n=1 Tax=Actinomadura fulvescens TaxID=46160 RepID=A0ABN3PHV4_9ACTN
MESSTALAASYGRPSVIHTNLAPFSDDLRRGANPTGDSGTEQAGRRAALAPPPR